LRDIITVAKMHNLDIGFLSLDQEKAFDLEAFGFGPYFVSLIKMLYNGIFSMLRLNGSLTRPFSVTRGIRQGCPLSGLFCNQGNKARLPSFRSFVFNIN